MLALLLSRCVCVCVCVCVRALRLRQSKEPYRELLFVAGGLRCASHSMVRDDKWPGPLPEGGRARQLIVGPVTDSVAPWPFAPLEGSLAPRSRFAFRHRPLRGQRNYAEALIRVPPGGAERAWGKAGAAGAGAVDRSTFARVAAAKVIGHFFEEVNVTVGPVVGLVESRSAVVLVEVDAAAPVAMVLLDTLAGGERRQLRLLPAHRPFAFKFEGLTPGRHYSVRFEGVENADDRMGSFTTPQHWATASGEGGNDPRQYRLTAVAVQGDAPFAGVTSASGADGDDDEEGESALADAMASGALAMGASSGVGGGGGSIGFGVWSALGREAERPFGSPDVFVHLGGQVEVGPVLATVSALLARAGHEAQGGPERRRLEASAADVLRGAYRTHWNLPGTRQALAHGCHLMLRGAGDVGDLLLGPSRAVPPGAGAGGGGGGGGGDDDEGGGGGESGGGGGAEAPAVVTGADRTRLAAVVEGVYRECVALIGLVPPSGGCR